MHKFDVPLSVNKTEGPRTVLSFLGIELDSNDMVFRLPADKLHKLRGCIKLHLISGFLGTKSVTLKQMQSMLGFLPASFRYPQKACANRTTTFA